MSAYLIFTRKKTLDETELKIYWGDPGNLRRPSGQGPRQLRPVLRFWRAIPSRGIVIAEFPSFEVAKAWYESPAYPAIRHHRLEGAIYNGLVVQGV